MKQRARHIAKVLAVAPILWGLDVFLRALNASSKTPPKETFGEFIWDAMWDELEG